MMEWQGIRMDWQRIYNIAINCSCKMNSAFGYVTLLEAQGEHNRNYFISLQDYNMMRVYTSIEYYYKMDENCRKCWYWRFVNGTDYKLDEVTDLDILNIIDTARRQAKAAEKNLLKMEIEHEGDVV